MNPEDLNLAKPQLEAPEKVDPAQPSSVMPTQSTATPQEIPQSAVPAAPTLQTRDNNSSPYRSMVEQIPIRTQKDVVDDAKQLSDLKKSAYDRTDVNRVKREVGDFAVGIVQGTREVGQELRKNVLNISSKIGLNPKVDEQLARYTAQSNVQRSDINSQFPDSNYYNAGKFTGNVVVPALALGPLGGGASVAGRIAANAVGAGAISALQPSETSDFQTGKFVTGALAGGALTGGTILGGKILKSGGRLVGFKPTIKQDILEQAGKTTSTQKMVRSASKIGVPITPAEASKRIVLIEQQNKLGITDKVQNKIDDYFDARKYATAKAVDNFEDKILPQSTDDAINLDIRTTAQNILAKDRTQLIQASAPLYQKAYSQQIPPTIRDQLLKDPIINKRYMDIKENPMARKLLKGYPEDSIGEFDLIKKDLYRSVVASHKNNLKEVSKNILDSVSKIRNTLDDYSPDYKLARKFYEEGNTESRQLSETMLGKIARVGDKDIQTISRKLLDTKQTSPEQFRAIRDELLYQKPEAWYGMVRHHVEERLSLAKVGSQLDEGTKFYKALLGSKAEQQRLMEALKYNKPARENLIHITRVFSSLRSRKVAQSPEIFGGFERERSIGVMSQLGVFMGRLAKGSYNNTVANIIFNPKWAKDMAKLNKAPTLQKYLMGLKNLLNRVSAVSATKVLTGEE